eukprot:COSAG02_NODE_25807_length_648_cov_1.316940_1_plen_205_part_01
MNCNLSGSVWVGPPRASVVRIRPAREVTCPVGRCPLFCRFWSCNSPPLLETKRSYLTLFAMEGYVARGSSTAGYASCTVDQQDDADSSRSKRAAISDVDRADKKHRADTGLLEQTNKELADERKACNQLRLQLEHRPTKADLDTAVQKVADIQRWAKDQVLEVARGERARLAEQIHADCRTLGHWATRAHGDSTVEWHELAASEL